MLKHVVLFKLPDGKKNDFIELKSRLDKLKSQIPEVECLETGVNISDSKNAYDVCLITRFADAAGLDNYRKHKAHQEVLEYIKKIKAKIVVTDFEN